MDKLSKSIIPVALGAATVLPFVQWKYLGLNGWELIVTPSAILSFAFLLYKFSKKLKVVRNRAAQIKGE